MLGKCRKHVVGFAAISALVGCSAGRGDETSVSGSADLRASSTPDPKTAAVGDSVSCTKDGLTLAVTFDKPQVPCTAASFAGCQPNRVDITGLPPDGANDFFPGAEAGTLFYDKHEVGQSGATAYFMMLADGQGSWAVLDITTSGDEDSGTMTVKSADSDVVTKSFSGGFFCKVTPAPK